MFSPGAVILFVWPLFRMLSRTYTVSYFVKINVQKKRWSNFEHVLNIYFNFVSMSYFDNDLAGSFPIYCDNVKIAPRQKLKRGSILAVDPFNVLDKQFILVYENAAPVARLMVDVETDNKPALASVAFTGCFSLGSVVVGAGVDKDAVIEKLSARCLFFKNIDCVKD